MKSYLRDVKLEDWFVCLLSFASVVAMLVTLNVAGSPSQVFPDGFINMRPYILGLFLAYSGLLIVNLIKHRPKSPIAFVLREGLGRNLLRRIFLQLPIILAIALFMPAFSAIKSSIPLLNPFGWDEYFIALDITLHGTDPWKLMQPLLGQPWITSLLSQIYHLWFVLIYVGPVVVAVFVRDRTLRFRFFIGYIATWGIVGTVLAVAFSSVGPCFVGPILGNDHFDEQMQYLYWANTHNSIAVLDIQQLLLEWYRSGQYGLGRGITAMPSMHVALAFLYFLFAIKISKRIAWFFFAFFVLISIGSVHLAYHYAVDGYLSIVVTWLIWISTKPLAQAIIERRAKHGGGKLGARPAVVLNSAPPKPE